MENTFFLLEIYSLGFFCFDGLLVKYINRIQKNLSQGSGNNGFSMSNLFIQYWAAAYKAVLVYFEQNRDVFWISGIRIAIISSIRVKKNNHIGI